MMELSFYFAQNSSTLALPRALGHWWHHGILATSLTRTSDFFNVCLTCRLPRVDYKSWAVKHSHLKILISFCNRCTPVYVWNNSLALSFAQNLLLWISLFTQDHCDFSMVLHASIDLHLLVILVHLNRQGNWELKRWWLEWRRATRSTWNSTL